MLGFDNDFQKLCAWHMLPESQDCIESCPDTTAGKLNPQNASYIMQVLNFGIQQCMEHSDFALVTGPIGKENIIEGGISFQVMQIHSRTNKEYRRVGVVFQRG